ncbi:hypothetical protein HYPSUDRAFT_182650 [Hypholoma sublateritium FD-334 SS-4]|uniref:Velvet domain-containing protein n=1 Tax=Hypholoma sublateritium (strain FD-334 SS-4) TaxID=945553 RepID=A0A0D2LD26_HYPSF|nr:hypothetical protein HYPSUDRAFT_182650 [Hypholoma sublateritium FD-334 SS-4]
MTFNHPPPPNARYRSLSSSAPSSPTASSTANNSYIGRPNYFTTGPHTGKTVRMELIEIQKADLGRKYAKVDRRPLDPPPVVILKIYELTTNSHGEEVELEMQYDESQLLGLLCTVDLFPASSSDVISSQSARATSASGTRAKFISSSSSPPSASSDYGPEILHYHYQQERSMSSPNRSMTGYIYPPEGMSDVVYHLEGFPITENSKQTQALVGATFVQPSIIDYQGKKAIVFVFADLAVKIEGSYFLRYRVFDIFGRRHDQELGITAETYGGSFRVYSTKEFPGLSASTELTKLLARWGVRLNIRETERRRRKRASSGDRRSPTSE